METQKTKKSHSSLKEQHWFTLPDIKPTRKGEYLGGCGREGR